jgi:membrane-associated PAP2 superfamily phosphatase
MVFVHASLISGFFVAARDKMYSMSGSNQVVDLKDVRFAAINLLLLVFTGFCLTWLSRDGALDLAATRILFDPVAGVFPFRDTPLFAVAGHTGLKWLVLFFWFAAAVSAVFIRQWRSPLVFFCIAVAVTTAVAALLKMASAHSCPWDLRDFGGTADWFPLFDGPTSLPGPGHCWPGGHAAGGFSLMAGYFVFRGSHPVVARIVLAVALGLGALMSYVQMARGAHFLSHNLWSLWIAWFCSLAVFLMWRMFSGAFLFRGR